MTLAQTLFCTDQAIAALTADGKEIDDAFDEALYFLEDKVDYHTVREVEDVFIKTYRDIKDAPTEMKFRSPSTHTTHER